MNGDAGVMQMLHDIHASTEVQSYMQQVCTDLAAALTGVSAPWQHVSTRACSDSGALLPEDVPAALRAGNLRERCGILYNLVSAESAGQRRVLCELLRLSAGGAACARALDCMELRRAAVGLPCAPWDGPGMPAYRTLRAADAQHAHALPVQRAFPPLTARELRVQRPRAGLLCWTTGHMRWEVQRRSAYACDARHARESVVAGPSGHAFVLMSAMRIFRRFRLDMWLLICVVWLVGADHHSIHEVVQAAQCCGLRSPPHVSSLCVTRLVLKGVLGRRGVR